MEVVGSDSAGVPAGSGASSGGGRSVNPAGFAVMQKRLTAAGLWPETNKRVKELVDAKVARKEAWWRALGEMEERLKLAETVLVNEGSGPGAVVKATEKIVEKARDAMAEGAARAEREELKRLRELERKLKAKRRLRPKVPRESFGNRTCSPLKAIEWVARVLEWRGVKPEDAPSPEAWGLYVWAKASDANWTNFWGSMYRLVLPKTESAARGGGADDDGRDVLATLKAIGG